MVPLSKPVFASLGFMTLVQKWNSYTTSMIYIRNEDLYTLQYLLQRIMEEAEWILLPQAIDDIANGRICVIDNKVKKIK